MTPTQVRILEATVSDPHLPSIDIKLRAKYDHDLESPEHVSDTQTDRFTACPVCRIVLAWLLFTIDPDAGLDDDTGRSRVENPTSETGEAGVEDKVMQDGDIGQSPVKARITVEGQAAEACAVLTSTKRANKAAGVVSDLSTARQGGPRLGGSGGHAAAAQAGKTDEVKPPPQWTWNAVVEDKENQNPRCGNDVEADGGDGR